MKPMTCSKTSSRKSNPSVTITIPLDKSIFDEGLALKGYVYNATKQITRYRVHQYSDLDDSLGKGWHFRGLNGAGDYCFVHLNTIEYYLSQRRPITHYVPNVAVKTLTPGGHVLHFTFIRGNGSSSDSFKQRHLHLIITYNMMDSSNNFNITTI